MKLKFTNPRFLLRAVALLAFIVSMLWVVFDPGFEPLLGFLTAILSFILSFVVEGQEHREACVGSINAYRRTDLKTQLVVCSRRKEYNALVETDPDNRLLVDGAIRLSLLEPEQIDAYLRGIGADHLRDAVAEDDDLRDLARRIKF